MSTGFTFPWEKAAMHGEELPEGLSLPDQMAYTCLPERSDSGKRPAAL